MARPRAFDEDKALQAALLVFWRKGYADTSMADLVAATGLSRSSLYGSWGDKEGLFAAVLEQYEARIVAFVLGPLEAPDADLQTIASLLQALGAHGSSVPTAYGCLIAHTASERARVDRRAAAHVHAHQARMEAAFAHALRNAVDRGQLRSTFDVEAVAASLTVFARGLTTQVRAGASAESLAASVRGVLALLH